ncbi:hypothetical protein [Bradyrhizobium sp. BRP23]|nr:hypothetical protein [Bradyrhizobium sp. BRP23]MCA1382785.1 hypothetical protein [Bradyrhizobium sp. BRP05]MCA1421891.1 hypothetical protein [Bradyrhizobium sp. BRP23]
MKRAIRRVLTAAATVALALPAFAQEPPAPTSDKWRPKAGVYAEPGKNF